MLTLAPQNCVANTLLVLHVPQSPLGLVSRVIRTHAMPIASNPPLTLAPDQTIPEATVDPLDEVFDVVDDSNTPVSTASRQQCHDEGLLHRSTHVFLFRMRLEIGNPKPVIEVLLQRRSERKKVGGGLWDVSVAEHLSAGESYQRAAVRGMREELGLTVKEEELVRVREVYLSRQFYEEAGVLDHMFTETFGLLYEEGRHGEVVVDGEEVTEVEWWRVERVVRGRREAEGRFTRWLLIELKDVDLTEMGRRITGEM